MYCWSHTCMFIFSLFHITRIWKLVLASSRYSMINTSKSSFVHSKWLTNSCNFLWVNSLIYIFCIFCETWVFYLSSIETQIISFFINKNKWCLWHIFIVIWFNSVLGHVFSWTQFTSNWLFIKSSLCWTKILRVFMENCIFSKTWCLIRLKVLSRSWRNYLIFFVIIIKFILWCLILFNCCRWRSSIYYSSGYSRIFNRSINMSRWIFSRTNIYSSLSFDKVILSLIFIITPLYCASWTFFSLFICLGYIVLSWTYIFSIMRNSLNFWNKNILNTDGSIIFMIFFSLIKV